MLTSFALSVCRFKGLVLIDLRVLRVWICGHRRLHAPYILYFLFNKYKYSFSRLASLTLAPINQPINIYYLNSQSPQVLIQLSSSNVIQELLLLFILYAWFTHSNRRFFILIQFISNSKFPILKLLLITKRYLYFRNIIVYYTKCLKNLRLIILPIYKYIYMYIHENNVHFILSVKIQLT
jgi:hypothetical protein